MDVLNNTGSVFSLSFPMVVFLFANIEQFSISLLF
jgi:hypothetical protein